MRQATVGIQRALKQHLHLAAAGLVTMQARRNHAGVVKHQQVARFQKLEQIREAAMFQRTALAIHAQQTAITALLGRIAGN